MTDASFGDLLVRMVVSLAVVFGLIAVAYQVMRRRQGGGGRASLGRSRPTRARVVGGGRNSAKSAPRRGLRVLTRVGIGRTTQLVAVQFADDVLLIAASEHGSPTVVGTMPLATWEAANALAEERIPLSMPATPATSRAATPDRTAPRGFVEALREATVRRA